MNFDLMKLDYFGHRIQMVCFTKAGECIDSCNTIHSFNPGDNVYDQIIFLESIKEQIEGLSGRDQLNFHCINDIFGNNGTFDLGFELTETGGEEVVLWSIGDFSFQYQQLITLQQSRNENIIHKEELKHMNEKLNVKNELLSDRIHHQPSIGEGETIFLKLDSLLVKFNVKDICMAEAYGDYVKIHTVDGKTHIIYSTFKKIEEKLSPSDYARVHRSYVVRLDKIENIDNHNLIINEKVVPISQKYRTSFLEKINTL